MTHRTFATILISIFLAQGLASAQSVPPAFAYKITMGAGPGTGSMEYSMDVAIKSTNADGSRPATLTIHVPKMPPLDKKTMDATISPFGAITVGSTGEMPKNYNPYSVAQAKQMSQAASGPMMQMLINPLNTFANGLANAPSFKTGATWQARSNETMSDITYTVTGHEQRNGRDTAVITMKSTPGGPSVTGQGNYDPISRLVVAVHCEIRQTPDAKEAQILDAAMNSPR
jgi:hypothetical protein